MTPETLEDLFSESLKELYDVEQQLVEALPKMARAAASARLRETFQEHLRRTRSHVQRLIKCFEDTKKSPQVKIASGMKALVGEGEQAISVIEQSPLRDAALIGIGRRIEHYELAAYSVVLSFARFLGYRQSAALLEETLHEEHWTDDKLSEIAETAVNQEALQLGAHQRG